MDVNKFNTKLNKLDGVIHTVEEEVTLKDGVYEGFLAHDNVNKKSVNIYTGSTLTGDKITNYFLSTPTETPWKYSIKIMAPNVDKAYITYETIGDQVEAEDINNVQNEIIRTQQEVNVTNENINNEINRAKNAEEVLTNNLNSEITRAKAAENDITNVINTNKPIWDDKYSKNETDNKLSALVTSLDWKEAVNTFSDLTTTYPNAEEGWTVNVKNEDTNYQFNGTDWKDIGISAIPLATKDVDGKMSKQDKIDHDDMNSKKHTHGNRSILDLITQALLDKWNSAYAHITDTIKHITPEERILWSNNNVSNVVGDLTTLATKDKTNVVKAINENTTDLSDIMSKTAKKTTVDITYYVDNSTGLDTNDGLTSATAFKTIQHAINSLPQIINHNVAINISAGTYNEDITLYNFIGGGSINLNGDTLVSTTRNINSIMLNGCAIRIAITGLNIITTSKSGIIISKCLIIAIVSCNLIANNLSKDGVQVDTSNVQIAYSVISNKDVGIHAMMLANVLTMYNSGSGSNKGLWAVFGGCIFKDGAQPTGTINEFASNGGVIS